MVVIATRAKTYYFFTGIQNYAKKNNYHTMQEGLQNNKILKLPMSLTGSCSQYLSVLLIIFTCQTSGKCSLFA